MNDTSKPAPPRPEFTEGQRALMKDVTEEVLREKGPDIARAVIDEWQSKRARLLRPKTWQRNDHYIVEVIGTLAFLLLFFGTVITDTGRKGIHAGIDTEGRLDEWATADKFKKTTGNVVRSLAEASDEDNPVKHLITTTLDQNPLMVFQGEQTFLSHLPAQADYGGCIALTGYLAHLRTEVLKSITTVEEEIEVPGAAVCDLKVNVMSPSSLTVPFFAQMGRADPTRDDDVRVVVHVARAIAERTTETSGNTAVALSPFNGQLTGLKVVLHSKIGSQDSGTENEVTIPLHSVAGAPALQNLGFGYWEIALNDIITRSSQTETTQERMFERHHAIEVIIQEEAHKDGKVQQNEQIHVRVFVFVNTLKPKT